jgi:hypothetical protein
LGAVASVCAALLAAPAEAQESAAPDRLSFNVGAGTLMSIPHQFDDDPCGSLFALEGSAGLGIDLGGGLMVESSVSVSVSVHRLCEAADLWVPPDSGTTIHNVYQEGLDDQPFLTVSERLAWELAAVGPVVPRVSLGGGYFLGKGLGFWSAGVGLRMGPPGSARVLEVERVRFRMTFYREHRTWMDGTLVGAAPQAPEGRGESLWAVRLRLPLG